MLHRALLFLKSNPGKRFLAVGHTDAKGSESYNLQLSEARARGVQQQVLGRHAEWGDHALGLHTGEDLQRYLAWAATDAALDCNPGPVDGDVGPVTKEALKRFRVEAGKRLGTELQQAAKPTAEDFAAFAKLVDRELLGRLDLDEAGLKALRSALRFVPPGAVGVGEAHARAHDKASDAERAHDRRVDIVFLDDADAEQLAGKDVGPALYGSTSVFRQTALDVQPRLQAHEIGLLIKDEKGQPVPDVRYRLIARDGRVIEGRSDASGFARHGGVVVGTCRLELLDIDAADWEAQTAAQRQLPQPFPHIEAEAEGEEAPPTTPDWSSLDDDDYDKGGGAP